VSKPVPILLLAALPFLLGAEGEETQSLWTTLGAPADSAAGKVRASSFAALVERARPAVVAIHTIAEAESEGTPWFPGTFDPWRLFPDAPRQQEGVGSGFIIRADGYVVTNYHVVENAAAVKVHVEGLSEVLTARVIGSDPRSDLALLKVESRRRLPVLPLGNSERLPVGAWVVAIGNPFGLAHVATKGIVSGKGRTLGDLPRFRPGYYDFIQTDAAIDRGNSGGPLLNLDGEVVGINTAINSRARGISFAVPVDLAKAVLPQLLQNGKVIRTYLGISIDGVTWELAESFGMEIPEGVLVTRVIKSTPAERAGLEKGDIILKFAGLKVRGPGDMSWRAATAASDRPVELEIWRDRKLQTLSITPVARKSEEKKTAKPAEKMLEPPRLGLFVVDLDPQTAEHGGFEKGTWGVVVVGVEADAAIFGIRVGDVIASVNDRDIKNKADFEKAVGEVKKDQIIRFYILRQKGALFVAIPKRWD
jgi:Do/DeqQ family serine protease